MTGLADLGRAWSSRARELEPYAPAAAEAFRQAAGELRSALRDAAEETLTLTKAAEESGYSKRRLRELIADGTIPQAGRKHAPRIRRADLPMRPGRVQSRGLYDPFEDAEELAGRL